MWRVDVAIVGAGPAGATLAALLAAKGVSVALYDRDSFPRDKLCGEFLSYDALPVLEPLGVMEELDRAGAPVIDRCRLIGAHRIAEFSFPHPARGVSRFFFDDLLVRTAETRGAVRRDGITVTDLRELDARVVVGAWGRWGRFDQQLQRGFVRDKAHRSFGFKRHYRVAAGSVGATPARTIDLHAFPRGYLGVNAIEGGVVNICGLVHASRLEGHKGGWDGFVQKIRRERPGLEELFVRHDPVQAGFLSSEPVIFRARSAVEAGIFMIGDAAGIIDPLTGNGMSMAVQSALLVAPRLLELIETPARRREIEDAWRREHRAFFQPRIAWSRSVAAILSRPRLLDAALQLLPGRRIGASLLRRTRGSRDEVSRLAARWFC